MINVFTKRFDEAPFTGHTFFAGGYTRKYYCGVMGQPNPPVYPAFMDELPDHLPNGEHKCLVDGKKTGVILSHIRYEEQASRRTWVLLDEDVGGETYLRIREKVQQLMQQDKQMEGY